jgi:hypothetical protein
MTDIGIEYGVASIPTLVGFGGRRAERVTDRIVDIKMLANKDRMREWIDGVMQKGDPHNTRGSSGGGLFGKLFS